MKSGGNSKHVLLQIEPDAGSSNSPCHCANPNNMWDMRPELDTDPEDPSGEQFTCVSKGESSIGIGPDRIENQVRLRFMVHKDIPQLKKICKHLYPIDYPDYWYEDITTNRQFICLGATVDHQNDSDFVGILVAEIKQLNQCNFEDHDMLAKSFPRSTPVAYILSLGVVNSYRRKGLATYLLDSFLMIIKDANVRAVFLHVLCENKAAVNFYERRHFTKHKKLLAYYQIEERQRDGYTYVLYQNGGRSACSIYDSISTCFALMCYPLRFTFRFIGAHSFFKRIL